MNSRADENKNQESSAMVNEPTGLDKVIEQVKNKIDNKSPLSQKEKLYYLFMLINLKQSRHEQGYI